MFGKPFLRTIILIINILITEKILTRSNFDLGRT